MIDIKHFFPFVSLQAETCPDLVIGPAVSSAIADICEQTGCLRTSRIFDVTAGTEEFIVPETDGLMCENILFLYVDGRELPSIRLDEISNVYGRDWATYSGEPRCYTMVNKDKVHLIPHPERDCHVRVIYQAAVKRSATLVPEIFFDHYRDAVVDGALSRVFRIAGQTFSNARQADVCKARFAAGVADIRNDAASDFTRISGTVRSNRVI